MRSLKSLMVAGSLLFVVSCASSGLDDALFSGLCVAAEADCLQSCRGAYQAHKDNWGYQSCVAQCQPGGSSC